MMARRRVEIGEKVTICYGNHKGKFGVVTAHERRRKEKHLWRGAVQFVTLLTYVVEIEGVGPRRVPGSYLNLV